MKVERHIYNGSQKLEDEVMRKKPAGPIDKPGEMQ
jgi:hypothetical protein